MDENKQIFIADAPDVPDCVGEGKITEDALKEVEKLLKEKINDIRTKRSYMLTQSQINKVSELKIKFKNKDLIRFVGDAIDKYYDEMNI